MHKWLLAATLFVLLGAGCSGATTAPATDTTAGIEVDVVTEGGEVDIVMNDPASATDTGPSDDSNGMIDDGTTDGIAATDEEVTYTVTGNNFAFAPSTLNVKAGQKVNIVFVNSEGFHDFVIDGVTATQQIQSGATETISFTAPEAGSYEYYCSVGQHRAFGMKGTLVVE